MTIYLGRVESCQSNFAWLKAEAMAEPGEYGWKQKANEDDFPSRGTVHAPKGFSDGLHEGTMWVFELEENPRYEQKPGAAKYSAVNLQPAYVLIELEHLANQEALRRALLHGIATSPVPGANHCHWLLKVADGATVQLASNRINASVLSDGQLSLMLSQASLSSSLDVTGCHLPPLPLGCVSQPYYHPDWLPSQKEVYCWDSDARFMERMVNRLPKLKRRCEQAGLTVSQSTDISKAKAREALEILELSGTLSGSHALEQAQMDRLNELLTNINQNQYLVDKLFELVYDNQVLERHLHRKEQEHLQIRQREIEQQLADEQDKLQQLQEKLAETKAERDAIQLHKVQAQQHLDKLNEQAKQEIDDRKQGLEEEFEQFRHDFLEQSRTVQDQLSTKLAETLIQNQLLQLVSSSTTAPSLDQHLIQPTLVAPANTTSSSALRSVSGISDVQEWQQELTNWCDSFLLDPDALYLADVICRSREIPMLIGDSGAWLAQCYASLFGQQQVIRYTPGPTTLSLEDLFFRGGTGAPTQFQAWLDKAVGEPQLVHLVLLEQVYCEQAHLWLPALARELRFGSRIPANVLVMICASDDTNNLEASASEAIWPIECGSIAVPRAGFIEDPKAIAAETSGLDLELVCPGKQTKLSMVAGFSGLQQSLRSSHGQSPETWSRFSRILATAVHLNEQRLSTTGQHLLQHLQCH